MTRTARCRCGQLTATCEGEPIRVSVCHCDACKLRSGGVFAAQARFPAERVAMAGEWRVWERVAESGNCAWFRWCPECGATIGYTNEGSDQIAISLGAFAGGDIPAPAFSVWEEKKVPWVAVLGEVQHDD